MHNDISCTMVVRKVLRHSPFLSKGQNISSDNIHGPQVVHIWVLGLNYHTAACIGNDAVAF